MKSQVVRKSRAWCEWVGGALGLLANQSIHSNDAVRDTVSKVKTRSNEGASCETLFLRRLEKKYLYTSERELMTDQSTDTTKVPLGGSIGCVGVTYGNMGEGFSQEQK